MYSVLCRPISRQRPKYAHETIETDCNLLRGNDNRLCFPWDPLGVVEESRVRKLAVVEVQNKNKTGGRLVICEMGRLTIAL
jgi:hypothetical protein